MNAGCRLLISFFLFSYAAANRYRELSNKLRRLEEKATSLFASQAQDASWESRYKQAIADLEVLRQQKQQVAPTDKRTMARDPNMLPWCPHNSMADKAMTKIENPQVETVVEYREVDPGPCLQCQRYYEQIQDLQMSMRSAEPTMCA